MNHSRVELKHLFKLHIPGYFNVDLKPENTFFGNILGAETCCEYNISSPSEVNVVAL